jgi:hypothetical protein
MKAMSLSDVITKIMSMFQWWVVIAPWEQAIRVRHGKNIKVLKPGIHLRIPGFDRFFVQSLRKRYLNTPTQTVTTRDGKALTVSGGTAYSINDIGLLYNTLSDAEDVIQVETMATVADYVAWHNLDECRPEMLQEYVTDNLNFEQYGLTGVEFKITDFVAVRTYRLINSNPKDWSTGVLNTTIDKFSGN